MYTKASLIKNGNVSNLGPEVWWYTRDVGLVYGNVVWGYNKHWRANRFNHLRVVVKD